jgi:hypothetical protein
MIEIGSQVKNAEWSIGVIVGIVFRFVFRTFLTFPTFGLFGLPDLFPIFASSSLLYFNSEVSGFMIRDEKGTVCKSRAVAQL